MKEKKLIQLEGEMTPISRTEENQLKGGFGGVETMALADDGIKNKRGCENYNCPDVDKNKRECANTNCGCTSCGGSTEDPTTDGPTDGI